MDRHNPTRIIPQLKANWNRNMVELQATQPKTATTVSAITNKTIANSTTTTTTTVVTSSFSIIAECKAEKEVSQTGRMQVRANRSTRYMSRPRYSVQQAWRMMLRRKTNTNRKTLITPPASATASPLSCRLSPPSKLDHHHLYRRHHHHHHPWSPASD